MVIRVYQKLLSHYGDFVEAQCGAVGQSCGAFGQATADELRHIGGVAPVEVDVDAVHRYAQQARGVLMPHGADEAVGEALHLLDGDAAWRVDHL